MPELPEAETIARGLRAAVVGSTILRSRVYQPDVLEGSSRRFSGAVRDRRIQAVGRRGKKVLIALDAERVLIYGLGMTGRLIHVPAGKRRPRDARHPAVRLALAGGGALLFDDVRRFGSVACLSSDGWSERSQRLGPEPLSPTFTGPMLHGALSRSRSPVRSWLLDQRHIAGIGNIYALEALYRAGIHPRRPANSINESEANRLHVGLVHVLREAIDARGTTLRDYRTATGAPGSYVSSLEVYGREGQACLTCQGTVERAVFGNRSAFFCRACQPEVA